MSPAVGTSTQYITFSAVDPVGPRVAALLGVGYPKWSNKGGWQYTGRTRRLSMTEYIGDDPYQMIVPCMLDGWSANTSVEGPLETLRGMMTNLVGPRNEPAIVHVTGSGIPLSNIDWVIQSIEVTDEIRLDSGPRTRVELNVTLFQYIAPDILIASTVKAPSPAAAAVARSGAAPAPRTYTVKSGDTLSGIAANLLGNANRWGEIATLNSIRDPRLLQIGTVLRIPA